MGTGRGQNRGGRSEGERGAWRELPCRDGTVVRVDPEISPVVSLTQNRLVWQSAVRPRRPGWYCQGGAARRARKTADKPGAAPCPPAAQRARAITGGCCQLIPSHIAEPRRGAERRRAQLREGADVAARSFQAHPAGQRGQVDDAEGRVSENRRIAIDPTLAVYRAAVTGSTSTLEVLPFAAGAYAAGVGSMAILRFSDTPGLGVIHLAALSGGVSLEDRDDLARYVRAFAQLRAAALSPAASARLLGDMAWTSWQQPPGVIALARCAAGGHGAAPGLSAVLRARRAAPPWTAQRPEPHRNPHQLVLPADPAIHPGRRGPDGALRHTRCRLGKRTPPVRSPGSTRSTTVPSRQGSLPPALLPLGTAWRMLPASGSIEQLAGWLVKLRPKPGRLKRV